MARPTKQGIDYFPLDCHFDDKTEMYLIEKGAVGLAVLVSVWQMIYASEGYYIDSSSDLHLLIKRKIDVGINEVSDCINVCLSRNIFDEEAYKAYGIITSKAIQKRYFDAAKKKKSVSFVKEFLLISVDSFKNLVKVGIKEVNSAGNATNVKVEVKVEVKEEEVVNTMSSNPKTEPVDNFSLTENKSGKETYISQAKTVLEFMNLKFNRNFRATSPAGKPTANAEIIIARLKDGYTVQNLKTVAMRKSRDWADQESMQSFLRPETLFRKSKFDTYFGECVLPKKPENDFSEFDFDDLETEI